MERPRPDPEALLAHEAFLRRIARPLLRDDTSVDDVVQETWLTALRKPPRDASRLRQWLGKVARSLALRARRAEERRTRREQAAARPEGDDVVARVAQHQRVVDAVLGLDEPYRTAVLLRFYDGLTTDEIGERSGVTGAAVRKRLKKALGLLRARLDDLHDGDRRAWSAVLLPFAILPRGKPAALLGGLVVGTKAKVGLAALLLLAVIGALWHVTRRSAPPARVEATRVGERGAPPTTDDAVARELLPPPVDFSRVDRDRDVHGVVVRRDGTPVAGALVEAGYFPWRRVDGLNHQAAFVESETVGTKTSTDGSFAMRLTWGDQVHLRASAPSLAVRDVPRVQAGERLRIVLAPATRLVVSVCDEAGSPIAGASVHLESRQRHAGGLIRFRRDASTDEHGQAVFSDLPDDGGEASIGAVSEKLAPCTERIALPTEGEAHVTLRLERGIEIQGLVADDETGVPVPGASVSLWPGAAKETRTDSEGSFSLTGVGRDDIQATAPGYAAGVIQIYSLDPLCYRRRTGPPWGVVENADVVGIRLPRACSLRGRVLDHERTPVAGALVAVRLQPGSISGECGPDGRFELVGPWGAGSYSLVVLARGHGRASASFGAGASDLGDIVLPPAGAIDGHVTGPQGSPLAGAQVILWSKAGLGETRRTDDLGRFRYPDLEPGWYSIFVQASGLPPLNSNVELPSGGARAVVELTFQGTRPLSVFVRAEDGGTVAGATVYVSAGYRMSKGVTGENGRVDLDLAAAPRTVIVEPPVLAGELRYRHDPVFTLRGDEREFTVVLTMEALARGVVRAPDGKPLARAEVKARHNGLWIASTATNDDGTFVIQVPRDSVFDLVLTGHSFESNPAVLRERHTLFRGELPRVRAGASGLEIRATGVEAKRSLRVRVLSPDGSPVEAATVSALPSAYPLCVQTDAHGYAEFTALAAEDVSIRVAATDQPWLPPETVAVVPEGQDLSLRFRIPVTITGTVFLPDGRPASQASVNGLKNDADVGRSCTADTEGRFRLLLEPSVEAPLRIHVLADSGAGPVLEGYADGISPGDTDVRVTLSPMK